MHEEPPKDTPIHLCEERAGEVAQPLDKEAQDLAAAALVKAGLRTAIESLKHMPESSN